MPKSSLLDDTQKELLGRYCVAAEEAVHSAGTPEEAHLRLESVCFDFSRECGSDMLISAARQFGTQLFNAKWGSHSRRES